MPESIIGYVVLAVVAVLFGLALRRIIRRRGRSCCDDTAARGKVFGQDGTDRRGPAA